MLMTKIIAGNASIGDNCTYIFSGLSSFYKESERGGDELPRMREDMPVALIAFRLSG